MNGGTSEVVEEVNDVAAFPQPCAKTGQKESRSKAFESFGVLICVSSQCVTMCEHSTVALRRRCKCFMLMQYRCSSCIPIRCCVARCRITSSTVAVVGEIAHSNASSRIWCSISSSQYLFSPGLVRCFLLKVATVAHRKRVPSVS